MRHWPVAGEEARDAVRRALADYERAVAEDASYQELNQRHLAIHLSLVGLTGSPRLVSMAESIVAELRLALAQIDRVRRNARDQAGSHHHLLDLLEAGEIETAVADLAEHLGGAEEAIIERLDLELRTRRPDGVGAAGPQGAPPPACGQGPRSAPLCSAPCASLPGC